MKLCLDFSAVKSGGGLQLATSFIDGLANLGLDPTAVIVPKGSPLSDRLQSTNHGLIRIECPGSVAARQVFERGKLQNSLGRLGITRVFTFFGAGLPHSSRVKSVVSVAYPIICYPDSVYWKSLSRAALYRQRLLNWGRVTRLQKYADKIVVETEVMESRLKNIPALSAKSVHVIPPSPSTLIPYGYTSRSPEDKECRFLFLAGLSMHKNLWRLPCIADEMLNIGYRDFRFVVSVTEEAFIRHCGAVHGGSLPHEFLLRQNFEFVGTLTPDEVGEAVDRSDFVANISDLESFTNNYMEAWRRGRPIVASDRDFSRALLDDSAVFLEPHKPKDAAKALVGASENRERYKMLAVSRRDQSLKHVIAIEDRVRAIKSLLDD